MNSEPSSVEAGEWTLTPAYFQAAIFKPEWGGWCFAEYFAPRRASRREAEKDAYRLKQRHFEGAKAFGFYESETGEYRRV